MAKTLNPPGNLEYGVLSSSTTVRHSNDNAGLKDMALCSMAAKEGWRSLSPSKTTFNSQDAVNNVGKPFGSRVSHPKKREETLFRHLILADQIDEVLVWSGLLNVVLPLDIIGTMCHHHFIMTFCSRS